MKRILAALFVTAIAGSAQAADVRALADRLVALRLEADPTLAYSTGLPVSDHRRLPDHSRAAVRKVEAAEDALWAEVRKIDPASLKAGDVALHAVLREILESSGGLRVCKAETWDINHMGGWQVGLPAIARDQPVGAPAARADALARWADIARYVEVEIANLKRGLASGRTAPKPVVRRVIAQVDGVLAMAPEASPLFSPAARDGDATFKVRLRELIVARVNPALKSYRDFLELQYLPKARDSLGLSAIPDGRACWMALYRRYTTLDRTPEQVFALGRETVAENTAAVIDMGRRLYGSDDLATIVRRGAEAPGVRFASAQDYFDFSQRTMARAAEKSRPLFVKLPDQPVILEAMPDYQSKSGVSARYDNDPDPAKPGKYIIPMTIWASSNRGDAEVTAIHEAIPGHHLQIALARELQSSAPLFRMAFNSAYVEGWARYAERLGEEAGAFATDYAKVTRRVWPARGLVIDPGLHLFGWTREQVIAYAKESGRFDDVTGHDLVDRVAAIPAQLTAYDSGGLEILALRREAEAALGPGFDLPQFHQRILEQGAIPLKPLRAHVEAWIASRR